MLEHGVGTVVDMRKAMSWYRVAAEKSNYARAQNYLGHMLYHGKGDIPADPSEAVHWFRKAAEQGNAHAQNNLGIAYEEGKGAMRDYAVSKEWYRKASEGNHASGMNNLGYIYLLEKNYDEAVKTFYLALALGRCAIIFTRVVTIVPRRRIISVRFTKQACRIPRAFPISFWRSSITWTVRIAHTPKHNSKSPKCIVTERALRGIQIRLLNGTKSSRRQTMPTRNSVSRNYIKPELESLQIPTRPKSGTRAP
jgi:hypothetical protein